MTTSSSSGPGGPRDLLEFLKDAELEHYHTAILTQLRVTAVSQFKYVEDEDLDEIGMTRPEIRRLKKFFKKECPQGAFGKIKKILTTKSGGECTSPHSAPGSLFDRPPPSPRTSKHIIPADSVNQGKALGKGDFGTVHQGVWTSEDGNRVQVALKCVTKDQMVAGIAEFLKEVAVLHSVDHEHIVRLFGVVLSTDQLTMVTELAPLRSLQECLKEPALRASFPVAQLCDFAHQIAQGMAHLESKRLIHRDLAARNILVFAKDKVKISDFGLSRALGAGKDYYQANLSANLKLPIAWLAPECIKFLKFTSASDVWSYGVTLWEMFSYGFQPWAACTGEQTKESGAGSALGTLGDANSTDWQLAQKVLAAIDEPSCQRLEQPDCCPRDYYQLMLKCWYHDPQNRPKFSDLCSSLSQMKPERVQALQDCPFSDGRSDLLHYKANDVITVLDKRPESAPLPGMWKGVLDSGKVGFYDSSHAAPYIEIKTTSPAHKANRGSRLISRKESSRKSQGKSSGSKKLSVSMISRPQNDLRHTGHIGYDGAIFGDVSFIGDNYDKLPVKVVTPYKPSDDMVGSTMSLPITDKDRNSMVCNSNSQFSFASNRTRTDADSINTGISDDTLTDVSSMDERDHFPRSRSEERVLDRHDDFTNDDDFGDFKLPDLSSGLDLDLGPSFMDEVMKALGDPKPVDKSDDSLLDEKSPLIEKSSPSFGMGHSTFDNVAMATEEDLEDEDEGGDDMCANLKDSGITETSFASPEISDYSKLSEDSPSPAVSRQEEEESKKRKPKLKLIMPGYRERKDSGGMKPLSASDEKELDDAIRLANEFATLQTSAGVVPDSAEVRSDEDTDRSSRTSQRAHMFSLRRSRSPKSPKQPPPEKKTFSDEIAALSSDLNEDVTPEAQEAYNMLVVRGSVKDKSPTGGDRDSFRAIRERRMQRSLQHQGGQPPQPAERPLSTKTNGHQRPVNMNIRKPQGIPVRGAGGLLRSRDKEDTEGEVEINPLRRLRESQSFQPKSRPTSQRNSDLVNGSRPNENVHRPNLNPNLSFFAKLKEQEMENGDGEDDEDNARPGNDSPVLPPRVPLRTSTINSKPRERKHPLDMSNYKGDSPCHSLGGTHSESDDSESNRPSIPPKRSSHIPMDNGLSQRQRQLTQDGDDSVFVEAGLKTPPPCYIKSASQSRPFSISSCDSQLSVNVKSVTVSAHDLGIDNSTDSFWAQQVNFGEFACDFEGDISDEEDEHAPIPGRYKTSDTVSYEDLMEFALDGSHPRGSDFDTLCDEVRLMKRVLSKDITVEDCMYALEETGWEVHSAIKLLKLKQLLSTQLADQSRCKQALMRAKWSIDEAATFLLAQTASSTVTTASMPSPQHRLGNESPELVHV